MTVQEFRSYFDTDDLLTCWDTVIDDEYYLPVISTDYGTDFPYLNEFEQYIKTQLEVMKVADNGVILNAYELLDNRDIIEYAKTNMLPNSNLEDIPELLFSDFIFLMNSGHNDLSRLFMNAFIHRDNMQVCNDNNVKQQSLLNPRDVRRELQKNNTLDNSNIFLDELPRNLISSGDDLDFLHAYLSRLQTEVKYYFGNGDRHEGALCYSDINVQLNNMDKICNYLIIRGNTPEYINHEIIDDYRKKEMLEANTDNEIKTKNKYSVEQSNDKSFIITDLSTNAFCVVNANNMNIKEVSASAEKCNFLPYIPLTIKEDSEKKAVNVLTQRIVSHIMDMDWHDYFNDEEDMFENIKSALTSKDNSSEDSSRLLQFIHEDIDNDMIDDDPTLYQDMVNFIGFGDSMNNILEEEEEME